MNVHNLLHVSYMSAVVFTPDSKVDFQRERGIDEPNYIPILRYKIILKHLHNLFKAGTKVATCLFMLTLQRMCCSLDCVI